MTASVPQGHSQDTMRVIDLLRNFIWEDFRTTDCLRFTPNVINIKEEMATNYVFTQPP